ncbi:cyclophilin-like fold protein [Paradevosia shaoguanensis]|uniref:Cyclophilin-like fold protein n=1 Tax=Paradevosia shaoguanensis TaxID=1335043 RepID=A0AA41QMB5_9HYPH|nr:cyclophilin-like fold protein [Paradevosia shaoguanensis]MCF1742751.1 MFS transporter [Paradevosia shaoguanensis]MCI0127234.1 cyclophilin-like fold protein [Paradevosia shaoguanensis]
MTMSRRTFIGSAIAGVVISSSAAAQEDSVANNQEPTDMRVRFTFNSLTMTAVLYDNPSARDFFSMLPLDLMISNYGHNEKIAYLPRKLTEEGSGVFSNEQPYDLCYYMPWGNLAMFYADYRHPGLIRLGRFEDGRDALHVEGEFPLRIEAV